MRFPSDSTERFVESDIAWRPGDVLPIHNPHCIVCGADSATALMVEPFHVDEHGTGVAAKARFDERHQGAPLYAHGGFVASVLDDACGYLSFLVARMSVTVHLEVEYRKPVELGHVYNVNSWCPAVDGRKVYVRADLTAPDGPLVAEASGIFITVGIEHFRP